VVKFTAASISDGTLSVSGPAEASPGFQVKHLRFTVVQGAAVAENEAAVSGTDWAGNVPADGFAPGPATGIGLAVTVKTDSPASTETISWVEPLTLT
jgi:hypothetical protein